MSIADKITSITGHLQKDYQSIANLGADLTNVDKNIENIAELLDGVYDRLPKTEFEEGESVTLENTLKGKLDFDDGKVGFGQSSQDSTQGYNLLPSASYSTYTSMGVTHKSNGDGTYILNGTSTGTSAVNYTIEPYTIKSGDYLFIGNDIVESNFALALLRSNDEQIAFKAGSQVNAMLSLENYVDDTIGQIRTFVNSGVTCSNYKIKPMIISGSTAKLFELYSGGYASPSPNWKQKVEYVAGKNMFKDGITFQTSSSNWSDQLGTSTTTVAQIKLNSNYYDLEANTPYTFKLNSYTNIDYLQAVYLDENDTIKALIGYSDFANSKTFSSVKPLRVWIRARVVNGNTDTYFIGQLEQGSTSTPYLPYNTIEEVVSGKNILDISKFENNYTLDGNGLPVYNGSQIRLTNTTPIIVEGLEKVTLTYTGWGDGRSFIYSLLKADNTLISRVASNLSGTTITIGQAKYLYICFYDGATLSNITDAMLVEGSTGATYEPYITPTSYQFSLGDHKFYGIGTYRDYILRTTGKNKFNLGTGTYTKYGFTGTYDGSKMKVNGTTTGSTNVFEPNAKSIGVFKAGSYVLSSFYTGSVNLNGHAHEMCLRSSNDLASNDNILTKFSPSVVNSSKAFTLSQDTELFMQWYANSSGIAYDNLEVMIQIEEGSTASDYQPYGVGNWYKVGKIGNVVVDGTNKGVDGRWGTNVADEYRFLIDVNDNINAPSSSEKIGILCNIFKETTANQSYMNVQGICALASNHTLAIYSDEIKTKTIDEVNTWLHTHILEAYYPLVSPTYTPITGTLAEQLEEWWNGQTLNGTTIITSNGNLPMIIKVRGLKGE